MEAKGAEEGIKGGEGGATRLILLEDGEGIGENSETNEARLFHFHAMEKS